VNQLDRNTLCGAGIRLQSKEMYIVILIDRVCKDALVQTIILYMYLPLLGPVFPTDEFHFPS